MSHPRANLQTVNHHVTLQNDINLLSIYLICNIFVIFIWDNKSQVNREKTSSFLWVSPCVCCTSLNCDLAVTHLLSHEQAFGSMASSLKRVLCDLRRHSDGKALSGRFRRGNSRYNQVTRRHMWLQLEQKKKKVWAHGKVGKPFLYLTTYFPPGLLQMFRRWGSNICFDINLASLTC